MFGSVTRRNVCQIEAPSVRAASSSSSPNSSSTGTTSRIVNGMQMKIVTSTIEGSAKRTWIPRAANEVGEPSAGPEQQDGGEADGDRREREREVDHGVHERTAEEPLPHEHPGDDEPEERRHHDRDHRDDPGEQERVLHLGARERVADDRDTGLERLGDDPDQAGAAGAARRRRSRQPPARHGRNAAIDRRLGPRGAGRQEALMPPPSAVTRAVTRTSTNEMANISVAIAAASAGTELVRELEDEDGRGERLARRCCRRRGRRCRTRRCSERTSAARRRRSPVGSAGKTTFRNESQAPAPSVAAASSSAGSSSRSTGCT